MQMIRKGEVTIDSMGPGSQLLNHISVLGSQQVRLALLGFHSLQQETTNYYRAPPWALFWAMLSLLLLRTPTFHLLVSWAWSCFFWDAFQNFYSTDIFCDFHPMFSEVSAGREDCLGGLRALETFSNTSKQDVQPPEMSSEPNKNYH